MSRSNKPLTLDLEMRFDTDKAFGFQVDLRGDLIWCPKQFVEDNKDGTFTMPEWLAIEKGLDGHVVS